MYNVCDWSRSNLGADWVWVMQLIMIKISWISQTETGIQAWWDPFCIQWFKTVVFVHLVVIGQIFDF